MRALWIDDKIGDYSPFIEGLEKNQLMISKASSLDEGIGIIESGIYSFDLFIIDLRMPEKGGIEAIKVLNKLSPQTPMAVLSSYLHLPEYTDKLRRIKKSVALLDKNIPKPNSKAFPVFAKKLINLIENPPKTRQESMKASIWQTG